jgi:hypothetical protein
LATSKHFMNIPIQNHLTQEDHLLSNEGKEITNIDGIKVMLNECGTVTGTHTVSQSVLMQRTSYYLPIFVGDETEISIK